MRGGRSLCVESGRRGDDWTIDPGEREEAMRGFVVGSDMILLLSVQVYRSFDRERVGVISRTCGSMVNSITKIALLCLYRIP
jgi:hypothetical protein